VPLVKLDQKEMQQAHDLGREIGRRMAQEIINQREVSDVQNNDRAEGWGRKRAWTTAELTKFCAGKSKQEIRRIFGKPDTVMVGCWHYRHMNINDIDSGKRLNTMIFMSVDGKTFERPSFMEMPNFPGF